MNRLGLVWSLGFSQLICWGISYYLIGALGEAIVADLGWGKPTVYGGFSAALLVMGLSSGPIGSLIDRYGGTMMSAGSLLLALSCVLLSVMESPVLYYGAWCCLGLAMRMTLYDAAFAVLAQAGGNAARAMGQITLLGGLSSTTFWPIGHLLAEQVGWRGAVLAYAGFALLTLPLHLSLPHARTMEVAHSIQEKHAPLVQDARRRRLAGLLYVVIVTLTNIITAGLAAHVNQRAHWTRSCGLGLGLGGDPDRHRAIDPAPVGRLVRRALASVDDQPAGDAVAPAFTDAGAGSRPFDAGRSGIRPPLRRGQWHCMDYARHAAAGAL